MTAGVPESLGLLDWCSIFILVSASIVSWYYAPASKSPRLPPGPRGLPFVGNILDVPNAHWLRFAEMDLCDIFSLRVMGQSMIIVNSVEVAEHFLDVRGGNFADRPVNIFGGELVAFNNILGLVRYGDRMRKERKLFDQLFGTQVAIKQFIPLLSTEIRQFATGAISLRIAYGYHMRNDLDRDAFVEMFETTGNNFSVSTTPAAFLVDIIPILRYWPEWLPGGGFRITAKAWSKQVQDTTNAGLEYTKKAMAAGITEPSFVSAVLEEGRHDEYLIKWSALVMQIGASDTTAAQLEAFFLAMSLYPDVQAAAQRELDQVVGNDRLPEISDRSQLPYIDALCKEVIRWHVSVLLALPHRGTHGDYIYDRGGDFEPLLIPKDSFIIPNNWKMAHDPERYVNPMEFNPSRFIPEDGRKAERDPASICFGYGRRLLADTAVFLECSAILSVFNISKARENGVVVEPHLGQTSGTIRRDPSI
ncbi:cytochrome P450 [Mycena haematopus]|nr:cytochrome P450 [Mycena haematopus]